MGVALGAGERAGAQPRRVPDRDDFGRMSVGLTGPVERVPMPARAGQLVGLVVTLAGGLLVAVGAGVGGARLIAAVGW